GVTCRLIASFSTLLPQILDEEDIEDGDITIFFYSGHGEDDSGNLIGPDVSETLAPDELFSLISALPGYKLMIVDACFSGRHSFSEEQNSSVTEAYSSLFSNSSPSLSYTWGVFASQDNEYSAEFNADEALESLGWLRPHGAFTASILMHLGMDMSTESISVPNRAITAEGIFNAACRALDDNSTVLGVSVEHTPSESSNFFDLVLFSPDI
ncbi:MAG: caspase family protein, partial [Spirochaetales bacterium]|nr:caspase family protein [Spirochaetales bacterium]